ncbi:sal-like protein 3 [Hyalella azteca]|uniref:Sal-like protein 3 n=1 Tax=Hyalella azteca TaxID=294128 RepID=A0A979FQQ3_HYAAZ|nr:sal-like protein 3 [Hyalella azteca]
MDMMKINMKECRVVMHKLSEDAVSRGWHAELNRMQKLLILGQPESDATGASGSSSTRPFSAIYVKEEAGCEEEAITIKNEPIETEEYGACPDAPASHGCGGRPARPPPASGPCKGEAQIEARDAHPVNQPASPNSAVPGTVACVGSGQPSPALAPEDVVGPGDVVSKASSSKPSNKWLRHICSDCEFRCTKKRKLEQHIRSKHSREMPYRCPECKLACSNEQNLKNLYNAQSVNIPVSLETI